MLMLSFLAGAAIAAALCWLLRRFDLRVEFDRRCLACIDKARLERECRQYRRRSAELDGALAVEERAHHLAEARVIELRYLVRSQSCSYCVHDEEGRSRCVLERREEERDAPRPPGRTVGEPEGGALSEERG